MGELNRFSKVLNLLRPGAEWASIESTYETLDWMDETQTKPTKEEFEAKMSEFEAAEPMRLLRQERDRLLKETDWWAVSDRTMTEEQITYRQALRNLPNNTEDPSNPIWPTKPS